MEQTDRISVLLAKALSDEATSEELVELMYNLETDPILSQHYEALKKLWPDEGSNYTITITERNRRLKRIYEKAEAIEAEIKKVEVVTSTPVHNISSGKIWKRIMQYAAIFIAVCGTVLWYKTTEAPPVQVSDTNFYTVTAEKGKRVKAELPDGSSVWLNGGSAIKYHKEFTGAARDVILEGEAFFDVVKQPARPFIVHASGIDIKVLGTAFNVKSYKEDKTIETTLIRGLVQVTKQGATDQTQVILYPYQKMIIEKDKKGPDNKNEFPGMAAEIRQLSVPAVDSNLDENGLEETVWIYNRLEFRKMTFEDLAKKMERWYNVKISFRNTNLKMLSFNGSFQDETIEEALKALQKTADFTFKINSNEVFIDASH